MTCSHGYSDCGACNRDPRTKEPIGPSLTTDLVWVIDQPAEMWDAMARLIGANAKDDDDRATLMDAFGIKETT